MSDLPKPGAGPVGKASLSKELQELIDREERFKENYGDFENSWTSTRIKDEFAKVPSSEGSRQPEQRDMKSDGRRSDRS